MKIIIVIVIIVVVLGGLAGVGLMMRGGSGAEAQTTSVRVEPVGTGDLVEIVSAPGQIQPKTKVSISAKITARITALPFDEGTTVKKGDVIVQLDSRDLEAQLNATEARRAAQAAEILVANARLEAQKSQIASARVQFADAQRELDRQVKLADYAVRSAVDQARSKVDQLQAQLEAAGSGLEADKAGLSVIKHQLTAAEAEIARARDNLSYTTITSPIDGIVTRMNAKAGEMVVTGTMNNAGTVIMEVSDLSEMQVDAQIDESNIAAVKEGQKSKIRISAFPDKLFDGTVKLVALDIVDPRMGGQMGGGGGGNQQGRWYRARIVVETSGQRIPAGLSADVDIETDRHSNIIKVPTQAVMGRPVDELPAGVKDRPEVDKNKTLATVVYLLKDDKAVITPVTIGASDMTHTEITSGLSVGDQLIVGPYKALPGLTEGQKVKQDTAASGVTTGAATKASTRATTTTTKSTTTTTPATAAAK